MPRSEVELFDVLSPAGLRRVLDDVFDRSRLDRLAGACGLKYPGMRMRSKARELLVKDLVEHVKERPDARKTLARTLEKETRSSYRTWSRLDLEAKQARLADEALLLTNGNLGLHLYLVARTSVRDSTFDGVAARDRLLKLDRKGSGPARPAGGAAARAETRLKKKSAELERKVQHLEGQLGKLRESEKTSKRTWVQTKGELAESRMLVERLRGELEQKSHGTVSSAPAATPVSEESLARLTRAVRRLSTEQGKANRAAAERSEALTESAVSAVTPLADSVAALQKELAGLRRDLRRERAEILGRIDELRTSLPEAADPAGPAARKASGRKTPNEEIRLGVFIDVQNVYYGAKRLKGKLDFDALLETAVRDRRRIKSIAYVVESKEIDQSSFIALLRQRAIEVRRKNLRVRADGSMKGDWDMELALDVLDAAPSLDVVVLVSGDGDFTSLVERVKQIGPRVEVIGFPRNTAKSLLEAADDFLPLDRKYMIS